MTLRQGRVKGIACAYYCRRVDQFSPPTQCSSVCGSVTHLLREFSQAEIYDAEQGMVTKADSSFKVVRCLDQGHCWEVRMTVSNGVATRRIHSQRRKTFEEIVRLFQASSSQSAWGKVITNIVCYFYSKLYNEIILLWNKILISIIQI